MMAAFKCHEKAQVQPGAPRHMTTDTRGEKSRRVQEGRFERLAMLSFVTWVFLLYKISTEIGLFMVFCSVCFPSDCVQGMVAHTVISALGRSRKVQGQPELYNKVPSESASFLFTLEIFLIVCVSVHA